MLDVSPAQACLSAALAAAAVALVSPQVHWPSAAPAAALDAAMVKPPAAAWPQQDLSVPEPRGTIARPAPPRPRSVVSDDLESARVIPSPSPTPTQVPSQAPQQAAPQPSATRPAPYPSYVPLPSQSGAYSPPQAPSAPSGGTSSFQACVIARESGGNPQVMNASGHYGLYQFSYSTWVAYGGSPADFGHASVAEQNQVFANAMATPGGASNWAPYDGC